ncbi:MAG TPA: hypothetical protein VK203_15200, partial [Nostocaceae cyanobacterium]|nr:hypothetical protein [Nostocaceae cyanobacterium]
NYAGPFFFTIKLLHLNNCLLTAFLFSISTLFFQGVHRYKPFTCLAFPMLVAPSSRRQEAGGKALSCLSFHFQFVSHLLEICCMFMLQLAIAKNYAL